MLISWLYETVKTKGLLTYNIQYFIEGLFAQDEFVSDFDAVGDSYGWYVPVVADQKSKTGKFDRIESMAGYFERGNVFFSERRKRFESKQPHVQAWSNPSRHCGKRFEDNKRFVFDMASQSRCFFVSNGKTLSPL